MATEAVTAQRVREALELFGTQSEKALEALGSMYAETATFQDPLQKLVGRSALLAMNRRLAQRYKTMRFEVSRAAQAGDEIFLTWTMELCSSVRFEGATHLELQDGLIVRHRDYWDVLGGFVDSIPVARVLYHAILKRFA
ncbi:MAG TPA: nuclear transport factor 2 family protein [Myxococcales bacterium]|jgi:limonene-1,2-epoxide hydrolase